MAGSVETVCGSMFWCCRGGLASFSAETAKRLCSSRCCCLLSSKGVLMVLSCLLPVHPLPLRHSECGTYRCEVRSKYKFHKSEIRFKNISVKFFKQEQRNQERNVANQFMRRLDYRLTTSLILILFNTHEVWSMHNDSVPTTIRKKANVSSED